MLKAHNNMLDREQFIDLSAAEQKAIFDENGFLWIPNAVSAEQIDTAMTDLGAYEPRPSIEYSQVWPVSSAVNLITNGKILSALRICMGDDLRFYKGVFGQWLNHGEETMKRGRQALHRDFQNEDGKCSPTWINCAIYCINLEPGRGPLWVVPGSYRLPLVAPGVEFEHLADQALMICARLGDATLFHCLTVHAGGALPNHEPRPSFFHSYRPGNVPPDSNMPPWSAGLLAQASEELRPLLAY